MHIRFEVAAACLKNNNIRRSVCYWLAWVYSVALQTLPLASVNQKGVKHFTRT